jgi:hypothetical protein
MTTGQHHQQAAQLWTGQRPAFRQHHTSLLLPGQMLDQVLQQQHPLRQQQRLRLQPPLARMPCGLLAVVTLQLQ